MTPFDNYPGSGRMLLGPTPGDTCRHGYGLVLMRKTGQTCCAYCGMDFAACYENWLQMAVDHVVPRSVCSALSISAAWYEDCTNKVLACAACNGFDNCYKRPVTDVCPASLEEFYALRDLIFAERTVRIAARHRVEREYFERRLWEHTG